MPTLTGKHLQLRPLPESSLPDLLVVYQETPDFFAALGDDVARLTLADIRFQWESAAAIPERRLLGVYQGVSGPLIGVADIHIGVPREDAASVWLLIQRQNQRQGYGQECMALIETWLIASQGVTTLCAIAAHNQEGFDFLQLQGFHSAGIDAVPPIGTGQAFWMCW